MTRAKFVLAGRQAIEGDRRCKEPAGTALFLGASNVALAFPALVVLSRHIFGGPVRVLSVHGHGRSYGVTTSVLGRRLCGIAECGLWKHWNSAKGGPHRALITDIGNDLFYGYSPEQIARWVRDCVDRLQQEGAQIVMTGLPLCNIGRVSPLLFRCIRTCIYPRCRLSMGEALARSRALDELLRVLCHDAGVQFVEQQRAWYGVDPLHIRRSRQVLAWGRVLSRWAPRFSAAPPPPPRWSHAIYLRTRRPEVRVLWGWRQQAAQPSGWLRDGTTISIF